MSRPRDPTARTTSVGPTDPTSPDAAPPWFDAHPSTAGHGQPADTACSVFSDADGTSAYGTAAPARFFVLIEQGGPWGPQAARQSRLDPTLGAELESRCTRAGGRFMLIRRPGGHPADHLPRHALVAFAGRHPREAWLLTGLVTDPRELLALDWESLALGRRDLVAASLPGAEPTEPALLVCTNGRRDVCCAVRGRPVAAAAHREAPTRVWEVSHTGGHRFAPTAVLLPWGQNYARIDEESTRWLLDASLTGNTPAALLGPLHDRGRSGIPPTAQCAEAFVRADLGETRFDALLASVPWPRDHGSDVEVTHTDGRHWVVHVERVASGPVRPGSCGKAAFPVVEHRARMVTAT
ncbi:MAG: sucrase ferredoxin [Terracoccus sp.]